MNVSLFLLLGLLLMPAPTNTSFLTATDLGVLPATVTQTVDDAGTTYTVYYKFTAATSTVVDAFAFGDLAVYTPAIDPWVGPAAAPTRVLSINGNDNTPIQFPVTEGNVYFLQVLTNAGNPTPASLTLTVTAHSNVLAPRGSFCVNDDTVGFPLAILSGTADYTVLRFVLDFPAGEGGDTLSNGIVLVENIDTTTADLYDANYALVKHIAINDDFRIRTCTTPQVFYLGKNANPATFRTITSDGTASAETTLTGNTSIRGIAASNDQTILYHSVNANAGAVKQWDITNGVALSDLVAGIANYRIEDIIVLADDSILVGYAKSTATTDFKVLRYSAAGATLNTYTFGQYDATSAAPRLATALDDPASFWVMQPRVAPNAGTKQFLNIKVSDGSTLTTRLAFLFGAGAAFATASATPLATYGSGTSCPFWLTRGSAVTTTTYPIRRLRQFLLPSDPDNRTLFLDHLELLMRTGVGNSDAPDPQVMLQISRDGGKTWGNELWRSAGAVGEWKDRVRWLRLGRYRNAVVRIVVSDPVDFQFVSMMGNLTRGTS